MVAPHGELDTNRILKRLACKPSLTILELVTRRFRIAVKTIVAETGMDQPKVSHHLAGLSRAGLVTHERQGRYRIYSPTNICAFKSGYLKVIAEGVGLLVSLRLNSSEETGEDSGTDRLVADREGVGV